LATGTVIATLPTAGSSLFCGMQNGTNNPFNGQIIDNRLYSGVLTDADVLDLHTNGTYAFSGKTLVLGWVCSGGAGEMVYDISGNNFNGSIINSPTWSKQDIYHYNITRGYSRYDHASLPDILVPYSLAGSPLSITPPTGYTKIRDNPAGAYHNGCETLIDFTGGVLSPEAVRNSWETAWSFNTARVNPEFKRTLTSGGVDYRADRFLAYRDALSGTNLSKVNKYVTTKAI
jgi:hypothetical protein